MDARQPTSNSPESHFLSHIKNLHRFVKFIFKDSYMFSLLQDVLRCILAAPQLFSFVLRCGSARKPNTNLLLLYILVEEHNLLTILDFEMHPNLLRERALNAKLNCRFWLLIAQQNTHQNTRPDLTMSLLGVRM